ncbi:MAG: hypothetical protein M0C28_00865 [Candidatus Moduliflexus flocculans]|nr:hypothetical protein [Candidatus Moduliflexus flocculans]
MSARREGRTRRAGAAIVAAVLLAGCGRGRPSSGAPENGPAKVTVGKKDLAVRYDGREIFRAGSPPERPVSRPRSISSATATPSPKRSSSRPATGADGSRSRALLAAGPESFPCEADRRDRGPALVRHVSGVSRSLLNRAVYDRGRDWVFSVDAGPRAEVAPSADGKDGRALRLHGRGLRDRPALPAPLLSGPPRPPLLRALDLPDLARSRGRLDLLVRVHRRGHGAGHRRHGRHARGNPPAVRLRPPPDRRRLSEREGRPDLWLTANDKFPRGLAFLPGYIRGKGLKPGIWTNVAFKQADYAEAHKDWFVTDAAGRPARGNWVEFSLDASVPEAVDAVVRPGLPRPARAWAGNTSRSTPFATCAMKATTAHAAHFQKGKKDLVGTYRRYVEAIRRRSAETISSSAAGASGQSSSGSSTAAASATDGFCYAGLAQFNSVEQRRLEERSRSHRARCGPLEVDARPSSLTGSILLLTDKPAVYRTDAAEPARRAAPGAVNLARADLRRRSFPLGRARPRRYRGQRLRAARFRRLAAAGLHLFLLEIVRPLERLVRPRPDRRIRPGNRLHRPRPGSGKKYFVLRSSWTKRLLGSYSGSFAPGPPRSPLPLPGPHPQGADARPQLLATGRHISREGVNWRTSADRRDASGMSRLVAGDPYTPPDRAGRAFLEDSRLPARPSGTSKGLPGLAAVTSFPARADGRSAGPRTKKIAHKIQQVVGLVPGV